MSYLIKKQASQNGDQKVIKYDYKTFLLRESIFIEFLEQLIIFLINLF